MGLLLNGLKFYGTDSGGKPLAGGKLYTYAAGTLNPQITYSDGEGTTPNTNPVVLNAAGKANVFLGSNAYYFVLQDADGVTVDTQDDVAQLAQSASTGASVSGLTFIQGDGTTDMSMQLSAANTAGLPIVFSGIVHVGSATTIYVPIVDTMARIFTLTSQVTIDNNLPVRPEWFGSGENSIDAAIKALPNPKGGVVLCADKTYQRNNYVYGSSGAGSGKFISKPNITIQGARMPRPMNDFRALVGGTILQGTVLAYADNFELRDIGIDCGSNYTAAVNGSIPTDALMLSYSDADAKTGNALKRRAKLHNVIALANTPTDLVHAVIVAEGYTDVTCTGDVIGCMGTHGVVIKANNVKAESLTAYCNSTDGVIIKTDQQTTAVSANVQIGRIKSFNDGPDGYSPFLTSTSGIGVFIHAFGGNVGAIQIDSILERNHANGVLAQFDYTFIIDNLQIGRITTETNSVCGTYMATSFAGASFQRCQIGDIVARNTPTGATFVWQTESSFEVGKLHSVNCSYACAVSGIADPVIGQVIAENCGAVWQITSSGKPRVGSVVKKGSTTVDYASAGGGQVPVLSNGWTQVNGAENFAVQFKSGGIQLKGKIQPGTTNVPTTLPQFAWPVQPLDTTVRVFNGTASVDAQLTISAAGVVTLNSAAGGFANASTWLSFSGVRYDTFL